MPCRLTLGPHPCHALGRPFGSQEAAMAQYDVVVIGAGAAGLTAASLLAVEGQRVCLL